MFYVVEIYVVPRLIVISVRLWNFKNGGSSKSKGFWPKNNILRENHCILKIWGAPVRQKLGMILENKVVQKLKLEKKKFFTKNGLLN